MKHNLLSFFFLLSFVVFITGCDEKESFIPKPYQVAGKVEKGPFIKGSKITVQALDENYNLTGEVFQGTIIDDEGSFSLGEIKLDSPYALLTADGYYFNEVTGDFSTGQISMQSLVNVSDNKPVNVNVLTHLKTQRMMQLLKSEHMEFNKADSQVQKEVLKSFGLERYASKDVCDFSISSGTDEAGALIVVSSTLLKGRSDAQLTEYLANLSSEFKSEGGFTEKTKKQLRDDAMLLDAGKIGANIVDRYKKLGMDVTVPDLGLFVDWDGDGIAGNEPDAGGNLNLTLDKTELIVPAEGGTFRIKIQCKVPVTLQKPDGVIEEFPSVMDDIRFFKYADMDYAKSIVGNELVIVAQPAGGALMSDTTITVYTTSGGLSAILKLGQNGDPSKKVTLGKDGEAFLFGVANQTGISMKDFCNLDGYYTQSFDGRATTYRAIYEHTLNAYDSNVSKIWENCYKRVHLINQINEALKKVETTEPLILSYYLRQLAAVSYFQLASWWENVPYVTDSNDPFGKVPQLGSKALFDKLIADVKCCVEYSSLIDGQNDALNSFLYPPKGASLALLAKMYLHQKSYTQAYDCLQQIIRSNVYALGTSAKASLAKGSKELVWSLPVNVDSLQNSRDDVLKGNAYVPFVTYTEVLLSAAECAYHLGNQAEAQQYLNRVIAARNLPPLSVANFVESLRSVWQSELKGFGSYFSFLRRNKLAVEQLKIKEYQERLPIPRREIDFSSGIVQNPGW